MDKVILLLDADFRHPGLQTKRVRGASGVFEARVGYRYRMTYERHGDLFLMRYVGPHDDVLDNP